MTAESTTFNRFEWTSNQFEGNILVSKFISYFISVCLFEAKTQTGSEWADSGGTVHVRNLHEALGVGYVRGLIDIS